MARYIAVLFAVLPIVCSAAEIVRLTPENWDKFVPAGKEVDCIYGDYVLRNDYLVAIIADPLPTRHANMTVKNVGGMLIDLTTRLEPNDQLSCYYPNAMPLSFVNQDAVQLANSAMRKPSKAELLNKQRESAFVQWETSAKSASGLDVTVRYRLTDRERWLRVDSILKNATSEPITQELSDLIRADRTFEFGDDPRTNLFWANDEFFRQCYGVIVEGRTLKRGGNRGSVLQMLDPDGSNKVTIAAGESLTLTRRIFPSHNLLGVREIANELSKIPTALCGIKVEDSTGTIPNVKLVLSLDGKPYGSGYTGEDGQLATRLPPGSYSITATSPARPSVTLDHVVTQGSPNNLTLSMNPCGYLVARITDVDGKPIPCKVAFYGRNGTPTPDFGPDSGDTTVKNLYYSHHGEFRQELLPGHYDAAISYGPEYDAVFREIEIQAGRETELTAVLKRSVDTKGWVSADFHSHSSPSGDNTSSQLGRVQNLLCENVEFCPCTEHNRIDSYSPWLKMLGVEHLMATCTGMELTGQLLPINHQNAFPLIHKPRTQDGGGPVVDSNPVVQIERLALWDNGSDKLVQENHPNLVQLFSDKDEDGTYDGGFAKMLGFMDVMEVHPIEAIFTPPSKGANGKLSRNPAFHWMQLLNLGYRIPGVANTDAHYNFHGSGWLRNFLQSSTDDPAHIDTMNMVHAAEKGHVTMTSGPFLEVSLQAKNESDKRNGIPGDEVVAPGGEVEMRIRVQCSNWLDVNRVQIFVNGRPDKSLNFTRRETPERFQDGVVKFEATIPITLEKDAHLIVATIGEDLQLGRVMGADFGKRVPVALANPIFVDLNGDGFNANGDLLDLPFPK